MFSTRIRPLRVLVRHTRSVSHALFITGPTGVGKSKTAIQVARRLGGEIISVDPIQAIKGMETGSNQMTSDEQRGIPHHMYSCDTNFHSAGQYALEVWERMRRIQERGKVPILVGGAGMYMQFAALGFNEKPGVSEELATQVREQIQAEVVRRQVAGESVPPTEEELRHKTAEAIEFEYAAHALLMQLDPVTADKFPRTDVYRVERTLRLHALVGKPRAEIDDTSKRTFSLPPMKMRGIMLVLPREHFREIAMDQSLHLLKEGLMREAVALVYKHKRDSLSIERARRALGYREAIDYLYTWWYPTLNIDAQEMPQGPSKSRGLSLLHRSRARNLLYGVRQLLLDYSTSTRKFMRRQTRYWRKRPALWLSSTHPSLITQIVNHYEKSDAKAKKDEEESSAVYWAVQGQPQHEEGEEYCKRISSNAFELFAVAERTADALSQHDPEAARKAHESLDELLSNLVEAFEYTKWRRKKPFPPEVPSRYRHLLGRGSGPWSAPRSGRYF